MTQPTESFTGPQRIRDAATRKQGCQLTAAQARDLFMLPEVQVRAAADDFIAVDDAPEPQPELDLEGDDA